MSNAVAHTEHTLQEQIDHCLLQIEEHQASIQTLNSELENVEGQLNKLSHERDQYHVLTQISESLEHLDAIGSSALFWDGLVPADKVEGQLTHLRDLVSFFERRLKKITDRYDELHHEIREHQEYIAHLDDEIDHLKELEEESHFEYAIVREIQPIPYRPMVMPWTRQGKDEKKFRKIFLLVLLFAIGLGALIEWYVVPIPDRAQVVEIPERLAKLVKKQPPKPKKQPPKQQKKDPNQKNTDKKKPTEKERKVAREKVKSKGVLAFKNNFADLLDDASLDKLGAKANLSNAGSTARKTSRSLITAAANSSSGIKTSSLSRNVAGTGDKIDAVAFSRVESEIGTAVAEDRALSDGVGPSRTDEEIQIVFDRYKSALYRIYNRELRKNPTLQGRVVLKITIESDGKVSKCSVESADLDHKELLKKIVARVKRINFGAKEGVPTITILYPIDFLPSS